MDIRFVETNETEEFLTEERCHILELINDPDNRSFSIARARVEPDITTCMASIDRYGGIVLYP